MKSTKILMFVLVMAILTLTACKSETLQPTAAIEIPHSASVFCKENGGTLEMRQAADGSVAGFCLFSDGSECDEWVYFRGECKLGDSLIMTEILETPVTTLQPGTEQVTDWWGVIKKTEPGGQFDEYFERQDLGQVIFYGIDSIDPTLKSQIEAARDSGKIVHLYGLLYKDAPDYYGTQIRPDRIVVEE